MENKTENEVVTAMEEVQEASAQDTGNENPEKPAEAP